MQRVLVLCGFIAVAALIAARVSAARPRKPPRRLRILLAGPGGVGKTTQAALVAERFPGCEPVHMKRLAQEVAAIDAELAAAVQACLQARSPIPWELRIRLLRITLVGSSHGCSGSRKEGAGEDNDGDCKSAGPVRRDESSSWVLDVHPVWLQSAAEAEELATALGATHLILLTAPLETLLHRVTRRNREGAAAVAGQEALAALARLEKERESWLTEGFRRLARRGPARLLEWDTGMEGEGEGEGTAANEGERREAENIEQTRQSIERFLRS